MIQLKGNNDFNGVFDFFKWSAPFYETPMETIKALRDSECIGKTLRGIYSIGYAENIGHTNQGLLKQRIRDAGIEVDDSWWDTYSHIKDIRVPWEVKLCEPIQFVFDDESSLELLPIGDGGARIGVNSIPIGLENGLNRSNFCAGEFFSEVIGRKLSDIEMCVTETAKRYYHKPILDGEKPHAELRSEYCLRLSFEYPIEMELVQTWGSWYWAKLNMGAGNEDIPYSRVLDSKRETDEILITNGRNCGGVFWITPCICDDLDSAPAPFFDSYCISIDEYTVYEFLPEFLDKYFDPSIQEEYEKHDVFDWYGGNLYSFETMKKMLSDIRAAEELLRIDYSDPRLADIVSGFHFPKNRDDSPTQDVDDKLRREYAEMAVDFYQRFCTRIEHMMDLPGYDAISFAGP